jgi:hypothetical protein
MGLDATIRRLDGKPLGDVETVQSILTALYPGAAFGVESSGADQVRAAAERGVVYPAALAEALADLPATYKGSFEGDGYSITFNLGADPTVNQVDVVFYGATSQAPPVEDRLPDEWTITFP